MLLQKHQQNRSDGSEEIVLSCLPCMDHDCFSDVWNNYHINAKYKILIKIGFLHSEKMSFDLFINCCHGNQICHIIFMKFHICYQNIALNMPIKY